MNCIRKNNEVTQSFLFTFHAVSKSGKSNPVRGILKLSLSILPSPSLFSCPCSSITFYSPCPSSLFHVLMYVLPCREVLQTGGWISMGDRGRRTELIRQGNLGCGCIHTSLPSKRQSHIVVDPAVKSEINTKWRWCFVYPIKGFPKLLSE